MTIIKTSFISFLLNILGAGFGFIFQIMSAKYFGAEIYGQANYYLGYSSTINIFICFGLQTYLSQKIPRVIEKKKIFSETVATYSSLFLILQVVLFIILRLNNVGFFNYLLITIIAYLITLAEIILSYNISMGNATKGMFYRKFLYSVINLMLFFIASIFLIKEYYIYIFIMITSYVITCIPFLINNISGFKFNFSIVKDSFIFYIIQIIYGGYFSYSKVLQKHYGTFETVGVLSISITLANLVAMLGDNFAKVCMPEFSKAWNDKDYSKLKKVFMTISRINCYLVFPIAIVLIVNSDKILSLLGKGYANGEIIFSLIMLSQFINSFTGPNGTLLVMTKYTKIEIANGVIKLIVSIIVVLLFSNRFEWAIALSLAISEIVVNILKYIEVKIKLKIVPYTIKDFIYIIFLGIIQYITLDRISKVNNLILWVLLNFSAVIIFYLLTFILSPNNEDKLLVKSIKAKINPKPNRHKLESKV